MKSELAAVAMALVALAPVAIGSTVTNPVIPPTEVGAGQVRTYEDLTYLVIGRVTVRDGGSVVIRNATLLFTDQSDGIYVEQGGRLRIEDSVLAPHPQLGDGLFRFALENGTRLHFARSVLEGGIGLSSGADAATIAGSSFARLSEGLRFHGGSANVSGSGFDAIDEAVAVSDATIDVHAAQLRDVKYAFNYTRASGTVSDSEMTDAKGGVAARTANVRLVGTTLDEDGEPWTVGMLATHGSHVEVIDNDFHDWGRAVVIEDSTAVIEGNEIDSVASHGIDSTRSDLTVRETHITSATRMLSGIRARDVAAVVIEHNTVEHSVVGIDVDGRISTAPASIRNNVVIDATGRGIELQHPYAGAVEGNELVATQGMLVRAVRSAGVPQPVTIANNTLANAALVVEGLTGAAVVDNQVAALSAAYVDDALIARHQIVGEGGISISSSAGARVEDNSLMNTRYGITYSFTHDLRSARNDVTSAFAHAMIVSDSTGFVSADDRVHDTGSFRPGEGWAAGVVVLRGSGHLFERLEATAGRADAATGANVDGVRIAGATDVTLQDVDLAQNAGWGIRTDEASGLVLRGAVTSNGFGGLFNADVDAADARETWWGHASGPTHASNPGGSGQLVQGNAMVSPWLTSPP